jgi:hypothetical protein
MRAEAQPIPVVNTMSCAGDDRLFVRRLAKGTDYLTFLAGLSSTQRHEFGSTDLDVCISPGFHLLDTLLCLRCQTIDGASGTSYSASWGRPTCLTLLLHPP